LVHLRIAGIRGRQAHTKINEGPGKRLMKRRK